MIRVRSVQCAAEAGERLVPTLSERGFSGEAERGRITASYRVITLACEELLGLARIRMPFALTFVDGRLCGEKHMRLLYSL